MDGEDDLGIEGGEVELEGGEVEGDEVEGGVPWLRRQDQGGGGGGRRAHQGGAPAESLSQSLSSGLGFNRSISTATLWRRRYLPFSELDSPSLPLILSTRYALIPLSFQFPILFSGTRPSELSRPPPFPATFNRQIISLQLLRSISIRIPAIIAPRQATISGTLAVRGTIISRITRVTMLFMVIIMEVRIGVIQTKEETQALIF